MIKKIKTINNILIKHFGVPPRAKELPDPVDMLIATILSQNTNDNNSYKAYQNLRKRYPKWEMLLKVRTSGIEKEIKIAGLGKQKSKAIKNFVTGLYKSTNKLDLNHLNKMKNINAIKELTKYGGIGVKTASCVLLFALDRDICPVDTHVHRTLNRIGLVHASSPEKTFYELNQNFPSGIAHSFHTNLIRLGREICTPANPNCSICPLEKICKFDNKSFKKKNDAKSRSFMLLDNV